MNPDNNRDAPGLLEDGTIDIVPKEVVEAVKEAWVERNALALLHAKVTLNLCEIQLNILDRDGLIDAD
jgi:hypothetical protein